MKATPLPAAIETSAYGSVVAAVALAELRIRNLPAFFRPDGPQADGWITRKLFRSGRFVAFTLRRNAPQQLTLVVFVPSPCARGSRRERRSRSAHSVHFARSSAVRFARRKTLLCQTPLRCTTNVHTYGRTNRPTHERTDGRTDGRAPPHRDI